MEREADHDDEKELHVIGAGEQIASPAADDEVETKGVADQQEAEMEGREQPEAGGGSARRLAYCRSALSKKHVFGIAMLVIVDLIWVGSAGLTRVRITNQARVRISTTVWPFYHTTMIVHLQWGHRSTCTINVLVLLPFW